MASPSSPPPSPGPPGPPDAPGAASAPGAPRAPGAPAAPPPRRSSDAVSAADRELLAFVAEQPFVVGAQIAQLLGIPAAAASARLRGLGRRRLLISEDTLRHEPRSYRINARGSRAADAGLGPPGPIRPGLYRHDVGVTWLDVAARRGHFGEMAEVVSERRMRSHDARRERDGTPALGVRLGWDGGGARLHYPDLMLQTATGHRVAVELELSTKDTPRRKRILAGYLGDRRIDRVLYLVPSREAGEAIERSARAVGAQDLVRVQRFAWADGHAPGGMPRAAARRPRSRAARAERTGAGAERTGAGSGETGRSAEARAGAGRSATDRAGVGGPGAER